MLLKLRFHCRRQYRHLLLCLGGDWVRRRIEESGQGIGCVYVFIDVVVVIHSFDALCAKPDAHCCPRLLASVSDMWLCLLYRAPQFGAVVGFFPFRSLSVTITLSTLRPTPREVSPVVVFVVSVRVGACLVGWCVSTSAVDTTCFGGSVRRGERVCVRSCYPRACGDCALSYCNE